jgi:dihydroneopterin aldolase
MTDDIKLAFAHPSERAIAMANPDVRDRISLRDHIREVDIGAFQVERGTTQRVRFDVVVEVGLPELAEAVRGDDVDKILSYDAITEAIDRGLAAERLNLLETLAAMIADDILSSPLAARVFIRIEKLDRGPGALGVEIVRDKNQAAVNTAETTIRPNVVMLADDVLEHQDLTAVLDCLVAEGLPLILCVGFQRAGDIGNSQVVQKRIDLLSIEQNAWRLAGKDPRCVVVATRTELDWAMKNGQICVWAPSKLVMDATGAVAGQVIDPVELTVWFAAMFDAVKTRHVANDISVSRGTNIIDNVLIDELLSSG